MTCRSNGLRGQMELSVSLYKIPVSPGNYAALHSTPESNSVSEFFRGTCLVFVSLLIQGCATDLAYLPDSTFGTGLSSARSTPSGINNLAATDTTPRSVKESLSRPNASIQGTLHSDTDALLRRHEYAQAINSDSNSEPNTINGQWAPSADNRQFVDSASIVTDEDSKKNPSDTVRTFSIEAFDTSLQALLFSLSVDAGLQLQLNGSLDQRVTVTAVDQPLEKILSLIAEQSSIAWQLEENILEVWGGAAYSDSYTVNYLNIQRRTESSVGLATQVGTINASDAAGGSVANSSRTLVENVSEHHFWASLDNDLNGIFKQSLSSDSGGLGFSVNREAGLITVHAEPDIHRRVQHYLALLEANTQRQVLIEATVVEVALSDNYDAGVDWQLLASGISGINAAQLLLGAPAVTADTIGRLSAPAGLVSLVQQGSNGELRATLSLLEQFGDVRILSRPRIIALDNQSSVLKVVDNRVYFTDIPGYQKTYYSSREIKSNSTISKRISEVVSPSYIRGLAVTTIYASIAFSMGLHIALLMMTFRKRYSRKEEIGKRSEGRAVVRFGNWDV